MLNSRSPDTLPGLCQDRPPRHQPSSDSEAQLTPPNMKATHSHSASWESRKYAQLSSLLRLLLTQFKGMAVSSAALARAGVLRTRALLLPKPPIFHSREPYAAMEMLAADMGLTSATSLAF